LRDSLVQFQCAWDNSGVTSYIDGSTFALILLHQRHERRGFGNGGDDDIHRSVCIVAYLQTREFDCLLRSSVSTAIKCAVHCYYLMSLDMGPP
jgi:hypothetical protein